MPQLNIGQQGKLRSTPKLTRINGDDDKKVVYRNLGNNHAYPFVWASTATIPNGATSVVVASGIRWHGYDLATYASVVATPRGDIGYCFTTTDEVANTITLNCETSVTVSGGIDVALMFMLGDELLVSGLASRGNTVEGLACRGNTGAAQNLP